MDENRYYFNAGKLIRLQSEAFTANRIGFQ
jgi:hypothetical protein